MKVLIIFVCCVALAYGISKEVLQKFIEKATEYAGGCLIETGSNPGDIAEIITHKIPSRKQGKCLMACLQKRFGVLDADGKISKTGTIAILDEVKNDDPKTYETLLKIAETCNEEVHDDPDECETAVLLMQCGKKHAEQSGLKDALNFVI